MELRVDQRHLWLKWIGVAIVFLIFIFVTGAPPALAGNSRPTPSKVPSQSAANPAAILIPASASVVSASAAAIPIVDNVFTAVAIAAPVTPPSNNANDIHTSIFGNEEEQSNIVT